MLPNKRECNRRNLISKNVGLKTHEYIIMPNHFHCVIEINNVGVESISTQKSNVDFLGADIESAPTHNKIDKSKIV